MRRRGAAPSRSAVAVVALATAVGPARGPRAPRRRWAAAATAACRRRSRRPSHPGPPRRLGRPRARALWAPVKRAVAVRARAGRHAHRGSRRCRTRRPEGTRNVVAVSPARTTTGRPWVEVRLPVLPNGRTGWVPRAALGGYGTVHTRLVVDLGRLRRRSTARAGRTPGAGRGRRSGTPTPRASSMSATASPAIAARPTARSRSARAPAPRARRTGPPAGSSASTAPTGRTSCPAASPTAASGCATRTSSPSPGGCRSGRR